MHNGVAKNVDDDDDESEEDREDEEAAMMMMQSAGDSHRYVRLLFLLVLAFVCWLFFEPDSFCCRVL